MNQVHGSLYKILAMLMILLINLVCELNQAFLGQKYVENVDKEKQIPSDTEEPREVGDPLHPDLVRGLGPAHLVLVVQPDHPVQEGG